MLEVFYDPQAFILATQTQQKVNKKMAELLEHDIACGHMALGEYEQALELFKNLKLKRFLKWDVTKYAYYHNYCLCLFNLGAIEEAEKIYEQQIAQTPVINKKQRLLLELLMASYYYYKKDYKTSREIVEAFLKQDKITPYLKLNALYDLARIEESEGHLELARDLYQRVAKHGGQLNIAKQSRDKLALEVVDRGNFKC
ncbi:hypothetical protein F3D3_1791 [Fusibacter sp. 3D3]|nr:hypothetical protein F3D3_1791 [Fusibacter sp. 3D3]